MSTDIDLVHPTGYGPGHRAKRAPHRYRHGWIPLNPSDVAKIHRAKREKATRLAAKSGAHSQLDRALGSALAALGS